MNIRKQTFSISLGILLGFVAFSTFSHAQDEEGKPSGNINDYMVSDGIDPSFTENQMSGRINLDVKDRDLREILGFISRQVNVNVIPDPGIEEKVTIRLDNLHWRQALEAIARQAHCKIIEESENYIRFTQPPSISMEFQNADIRVVLELLAKQSGQNILIADDVKGNVSLSLRDVPWQDALDAIVKTNGYTLVRNKTANAELIQVVHPSSLKDQLITRHFTLKYVRPSDPYRAIITGIEQQATSPYNNAGASANIADGGAGGGDGGEGTVSNFPLLSALEQALSPDGKLNFDSMTNTFIIKDIKPKLDEIENIIRLVDVEPPLVYVEVKFISTVTTDILEHGIKFDLSDTPERDGPEVIFRGQTPVSSFTTTGNTTIDPLLFFGATYPFDLTDFDSPLGGFQSLGILDFTNLRALLKLLKDDENSRIIQEPSLTVVNNQPATIFVGDTVPFAVQSISQDQNGNIQVTIDENKRSPIDIGFTLYLIPHVIPDTDMIELSVIPNVSRLSGTTSEGVPGFERFQFQQDGSNVGAFIDLPRESKQTVVTYLRVQDRQTAVIGGLHTQEKTEIVSKVPLLSDIPILGNIFTWKRKDNDVRSLLILVTPHILRTTSESRDLFEKAEIRHRDRDYFYHRYEKEAEEAKAKEE